MVTPALVLCIAIFGATLRFYQLGLRGFWGDEIWTARISSVPSISIILQHNLNYPGPLYYVLAHISTFIFGQGPTEFAVRFPSALASLFALVVFYFFARQFCNRTISLIAALLMAVAPYQIWYAQEARFYALSTFLSLVSLWSMLRLLQQPKRVVFWGLFTLSTLLNLYNQPLPAALIFAPLVIFFLFQVSKGEHKKQKLLGMAISVFCLVVGYFPVLLQVLQTGKLDVFEPTTFFSINPSNVPSAFLYVMTTLGEKFSGPGVLSLLFPMFFVAGLIRLAKQKSSTGFWLLVICFVVPITVFILITPVTGFILRYVLFLQPLYFIVVASGIVFVGEKLGVARAWFTRQVSFHSQIVTQRGFVAGVTLALVFLSLLVVRDGYRQAKINDWRSLSRFIANNVRPGDLVVGNRWFRDAFTWYFPRREAVSFAGDDETTVLDDLRAGRRTWYVTVGLSRTLVSFGVRSLAQPVRNEAWQANWLRYDASFFPISETPAVIWLGGDGSNRFAHFTDDSLESDMTRSFRQLSPGESAQFILSADRTKSRVLELTYFADSRKKLAISLGNEPPTIFGGDQANGWGARQLAIPWRFPDAVRITVKNVGDEAGGFSKAALIYDEK